IGELAPHRSAVRRLHPVVVGSAHPQIHLRCNYGETLWSPPLLHALRIGEALPHELAWRIELTRDDKVRAFRGGHGSSLLLNWHCRLGLISWLAGAHRDKRTQPFVTQVEPTPRQEAEIQSEQRVGEDRIAEPQVAGNRSAQITGQKDGAEYRG